MPVQVHFTLASGLLFTFSLIAAKWLLPTRDCGHLVSPAFVRPSRKLAALGMIAFCTLLAEGVVNDWSALYLQEVTNASPGLSAAGYATFSLSTASTRLVTDRLVARTGPRAFVRGAASLAAIGISVALLITKPIAAILGFGLIGAGLAGVFPVIIGIAGRQEPNVSSGLNIATVSTIGYLGFLARPVFIGILAELFTFRTALFTIVVINGVMFVLASKLERSIK